MNEQWTYWRPLPNLSSSYYIKSITDDSQDGLKIIMIDSEEKGKNVLIYFPHSVSAYRRTDETFMLMRLDYLNKTYGSDFYSRENLFKVASSDYLKWIAEQSKDIAVPPYYNFIHYCIMTDDEIVDIACTYEPTVTFLDEHV